jgi:hypothetical protein|tara:strand:+ start:193 stop:399 length:207 start_codon:yes stop_codon:yes gene_type:complete
VLNVKSIPNYIPPDNPEGEKGLADDSFDFEVSNPPDAFGVYRFLLDSLPIPPSGGMTTFSLFPKLYYN